MRQRRPHPHRPVSDHFDGRRFFNPGHPDTDRSLGDILRWKLGETTARWPKSVPVRPAVPAARVTGLRVTMVGHATALVQANGLNILTDPVWSDRASPLRFAGPKRVTAPGIAFDDLPPIDAVLVSHNHYDHLDLRTLRRLQARHQPLIVTPLGNDARITAAVPGARVVAGDWGDSIALTPTARVHLVPAQHWSARGLGDRREALWAGFMLQTDPGQVYFAGDTGYGTGAIFRAMHARFGAPDIALLPIGAYSPRWFMAAQHTDPSEAVKIMRDTGALHAIGIHWGVFQLTDEPREDPVHRLAAALAAEGIAPDRFRAANPGDHFHLPA
ncbi:MBL fold metallo-hydrolase [Phaeovulum sp. W22_SRMD_FR3]|uniref:MBL fold metallo-hydrolase n=1 Tax=Phaeovulum sp. W22_SRMD_FR3 TaxID=3240274 RepID=UPI003F9819DE